MEQTAEQTTKQTTEQPTHHHKPLSNGGFAYLFLLWISTGLVLTAPLGQDLFKASIGATMGIILATVHIRWYDTWEFAPVVRPTLLALLRLVLAGFMLIYGIAKVIPSQFGHLLVYDDRTLGSLAPMELAWQFFGFSEAYQMLLGWAEVIPALLLLWWRTATLGALALVAVMVNVVAVNVFFRVPVAHNATLFLLAAIIIALNDAERLWNVFIANKPSQALPKPITRRDVVLVGRALYGLVLLVVAIVVLMLANKSYQNYLRVHAPNPLHGTWDMVRQEYLHILPKSAPLQSDSVKTVYFQGKLCYIHHASQHNNRLHPNNTASRAVWRKMVELAEVNDTTMTLTAKEFAGLSPSDKFTLHYTRHNNTSGDTLRLLGRLPTSNDSVRLVLVKRPNTRQQ